MDQAQRAMQTESNEVLYDVADHIAVITLNAPERMNTISGPMLNDLMRLLIRANEDCDVADGPQRNPPRSRASRLSAAPAAVQDARHAGRHQGFMEKREPKFEGR
jgi:hypothetical protein